MRRLLAVLGGDVSRSLSPLLHRAAADALGLDLAYVPVSCRDPAHFVRAVEALQTLGALGANVTTPFKAEAMALCRHLTPTAEAIGAVNTLSFEESTIRGDNTDGPGLLALLRGLPPASLERVQILGAGGSARAAAWAVAQAGCGSLVVTARRSAEEVAALGGGRGAPLGPVPGATLVVSTLPGEPGLARRIADHLDVAARPVVLDLAYRSRAEASFFCQAAWELGLAASDGRGLLIEQGALAFAGWTGQALPLVRAAMRAAMGFGDPDHG